MKILIVEPQEPPYSKDICSSFAEMQTIVGGHIQAIYPFDDPIALVCHEEGKLGFPQNRLLCNRSGRVYDIICGTFFLAGLGAKGFISLTDDEIEKYSQYFSMPPKDGCLNIPT